MTTTDTVSTQTRLSEELANLLNQYGLLWNGKLTAQDGDCVTIIHCKNNVIESTLATANKS